MDKKQRKEDAPNFLTCPVGEMTLPASANEQKASSKSGNAAWPLRPVKKSGNGQAANGKTFDLRSSKHEAFKKQPRLVRWLILAVVILVIFATGPAVIAITRAGWAGQNAAKALTRAYVSFQARDLPTVGRELDRAEKELSDARDALRGTGFWRDIPNIGTQIRALEDASSAGASTVDGVRDLVAVVGDLLSAAETVDVVTGELVNPIEAHRSFNDLSQEEKRAILAKLSRALPDIRAAQAKVSVALDTWNRIPQNELVAPIRLAFLPIAENLPKLTRSFDEVVPLLEVFIPLAGYPDPANFLVVLQNSDEMRATGGFLGTWGVIHVDGGDLAEFEFNDVYSLDGPAATRGWSEAPPAPLRDRLGVPAWFFRDANWSPDFPTSAARLADYYVRETKVGTGKDVERPTGVIALNAPLFEGFLRITGPITVDGVTFTADNFFETLEYEVEQRFLELGIPQSERKQILVKLGDELIRRLTDLPAARWPDLLDLVTESLNRKDIQLAPRDPALLARLDAFGWTGRAKPTNGDFLWVIDSNMAALKTDGVMDKEIRYTLDATNPASPVATVTLRYANNGPGINKDFRFTRYRDYVRLYVPEGAELIRVDGAMADDRYRTGGRVVAGRVDTYKELGKTVFGAFWSIEPKTTQDLTFVYRLPPGALTPSGGSGYRLDVPKQSGNDGVALTLDLRFDKNVQRAVPGEDPSHFGDRAYQVETAMGIDRTFEIQF